MEEDSVHWRIISVRVDVFHVLCLGLFVGLLVGLQPGPGQRGDASWPGRLHVWLHRAAVRRPGQTAVSHSIRLRCF